MSIDWYKIAKPQSDGYDSNILCKKAQENYNWQKSIPQTPYSLCNGNVAIFEGKNSKCIPGFNLGPEGTFIPHVCTAEWVDQFRPFIETWNDGCLALSKFVDEFWAWDLSDQHPLKSSGTSGCASGHIDIKRERYYQHVVSVTTYSLHGCSEGIYHEYAHLRLQALGIRIEDHNYELLLNSPEELYSSSVRFDKKRPMSAVLHGVYAWLMFLENNCQLLKSHIISEEKFRSVVSQQYPKLENGINEVKQYARFTDNGNDFIRGVYDWSDDLVLRCKTVCE